MKAMKKVLAVVLSLSVIMAFSFTCFADTALTNGEITVQNATENATYTAYKVFDATYATENGQVARFPEGTANAGEKKVSYTYTKQGDSDAFLTALQGDSSPFTLTETGKTGVYSVQLKGKGTTPETYPTGAEIGTWLAGQKTNLTPVEAEKATASDNTVVFSGLTEGYYMIDSTVPGSPSHAVTVDTTTPNVTVIDKNQGPTWDDPEDPGNPEDPNNPKPPYDPTNPGTAKAGKVILGENNVQLKDNEANVGDTVTFQVAVNATAFDKTGLVTYYYIKDELGNGFSDATITSVKVYPTEEQEKDNGDGTTTKEYVYKDAVPLTAGTDYLDIDPTNAQGFDLRIPFGEKYGSNAKIIVTYTAVLQSDATIGDAGNKNAANFTYDTDSEFNPDEPQYDPKDPTDEDFPEPTGKPGNDGGTPDDPTDDTPPTPPTQNPFDPDNERSTYTSTFAFGFLKTDDADKALAGAKFTVPFAVIGSAGDYTYVPADADSTVTGGATIIPAGTPLDLDANCKFRVRGVKAGTYKVKEVEAPKGYDVKKDPIEFVIASKNNGETTPKYIYDTTNCKIDGEAGTVGDFGDPAVQALNGKFVNNPGKELPATGGIGTTIFYVLGIILVLGAAITLITRRRMDAE